MKKNKYSICVCLESYAEVSSEDFTIETDFVPRIGEMFHYSFGGDGYFERRVMDVLYMLSDRDKAEKPIEVWLQLDNKFNTEVDEITSCTFDGEKIKKNTDSFNINETLLRQEKLL